MYMCSPANFRIPAVARSDRRSARWSNGATRGSTSRLSAHGRRCDNKVRSRARVGMVKFMGHSKYVQLHVDVCMRFRVCRGARVRMRDPHRGGRRNQRVGAEPAVRPRAGAWAHCAPAIVPCQSPNVTQCKAGRRTESGRSPAHSIHRRLIPPLDRRGRSVHPARLNLRRHVLPRGAAPLDHTVPIQPSILECNRDRDSELSTPGTCAGA